MFEKNQEFLIQRFIRDRTGILSPNATVQALAINVMVLMGWAGLLSSLLPAMMPLLNYKSVELLGKLDTLINNEFERISFYELQAYANYSKKLLGASTV